MNDPILICLLVVAGVSSLVGLYVVATQGHEKSSYFWNAASVALWVVFLILRSQIPK